MTSQMLHTKDSLDLQVTVLERKAEECEEAFRIPFSHPLIAIRPEGPKSPVLESLSAFTYESYAEAVFQTMLQTVVNDKALFCLTMASQPSTNPQPSEASLTKDVTKYFRPHHRRFMFWLTHLSLVSTHLYPLQCVRHGSRRLRC